MSSTSHSAAWIDRQTARSGPEVVVASPRAVRSGRLQADQFSWTNPYLVQDDEHPSPHQGQGLEQGTVKARYPTSTAPDNYDLFLLDSIPNLLYPEAGTADGLFDDVTLFDGFGRHF